MVINLRLHWLCPSIGLSERYLKGLCGKKSFSEISNVIKLVVRLLLGNLGNLLNIYGVISFKLILIQH